MSNTNIQFDSLCYYKEGEECFIENPGFKDLYKSHCIFEKYNIRGRTINKTTFSIGINDSRILASIFTEIFGTTITPEKVDHQEKKKTQQSTVQPVLESSTPTSPSTTSASTISASTISTSKTSESATSKNFFKSLNYYRKDGECFIENPNFKELFKTHNIYEKFQILGRTINKNTFSIQTTDSKTLSSIFSDIYNTTITPDEIDQQEKQTSKQAESNSTLKSTNSSPVLLSNLQISSPTTKTTEIKKTQQPTVQPALKSLTASKQITSTSESTTSTSKTSESSTSPSKTSESESSTSKTSESTTSTSKTSESATSKNFFKSLNYYRKDGECFIENPNFKELFKTHNIYEKFQILGRTINKNTFSIQTTDSKTLSSIFSDIYNTTITPDEIDQQEKQTSKQTESNSTLKSTNSSPIPQSQNITQNIEDGEKTRLKLKTCLLRVTEKFIKDVEIHGAKWNEEQVSLYPNVIGILKIDNQSICMYSNYSKNELNIRYNLRFISALSLEKFYDFVIDNEISVNEIYININNKLTQINDNEHFYSIVDYMLCFEDNKVDESEIDVAQVMYPNATPKLSEEDRPKQQFNLPVNSAYNIKIVKADPKKTEELVNSSYADIIKMINGIKISRLPPPPLLKINKQ